MFAKCLDVVLYAAGFVLQEIGNGAAELRVSNPMCGPGRGGQKAAADFVFTLGAGVEPLQAMANAVVQSLVVTQLEMQLVEMFVAAPVATVQTVLVTQADGAGHRVAFLFGKEDHHLSRQTLADVTEKRQ